MLVVLKLAHLELKQLENGLEVSLICIPSFEQTVDRFHDENGFLG
jgi:hypothetical protein